MNAPARRRPGASSPISLTPKIEPVNTGVPTAPESHGSGDNSTSRSEASQNVAARSPETNGLGSSAVEDDSTVATTTLLRRSLKLQAQTAVLRTQQEPNGYRSFAQFVNGAIERELQRLANEYNGGTPFERNPGPFRTGRPFSG